MKTLVLLFFISFEIQAKTLNRGIIILNNSNIQSSQQKDNSLVSYQSTVITEKDEKGQDLYYTYIRDCGKTKLPNGDYKKGQVVTIYLKKGRGCKIEKAD